MKASAAESCCPAVEMRGARWSWTRRVLSLASLPLLMMALAGCNAGRAFIASPGDYAEYRRVRLAKTYDDRMATAWEYLQRRPDGRYAQRLKKYFATAEPIYYRVRRRNIAGLKAYLRALPRGPHAEEAMAALGRRNGEARRQALGPQQTRIAQLRLDARKISRKAAAEALSWWIVQLSQPSVWQQPWSQLPRAALVRYRLGHPAPECIADPEGQVCRKRMVRRFVVSSAKGPVKRQHNLDLEVILDEAYHPLSVTLSGVDMLLRGREAATNQALPDTPAQRRKVAQGYAKQLIEVLFGAERVCNGDSDQSGGAKLDCDGVRITVRPAFDGSPDVVLLTPLDVTDLAGTDAPAPAPPAPAPESRPDADSGTAKRRDDGYE